MSYFQVFAKNAGGHRYNHTALAYRYKNLNIEDVLNLTVEQALKIFDNDKIRTMLQSMIEVGLEYLTLGQPTATLSGGELQRIKLISELNKSSNVYVLDEPSNGLSAKDVGKLLALLQRLISKGNTVIIIEHRLELIAQADWIIDLGPDGGTSGGEILFAGTPKQLLQCDNSKTAYYLRQLYTR